MHFFENEKAEFRSIIDSKNARSYDISGTENVKEEDKRELLILHNS